jgi:hypothetical protein
MLTKTTADTRSWLFIADQADNLVNSKIFGNELSAQHPNSKAARRDEVLS